MISYHNPHRIHPYTASENLPLRQSFEDIGQVNLTIGILSTNVKFLPGRMNDKNPFFKTVLEKKWHWQAQLHSIFSATATAVAAISPQKLQLILRSPAAQIVFIGKKKVAVA